jgi:hypothetical protein
MVDLVKQTMNVPWLSENSLSAFEIEKLSDLFSFVISEAGYEELMAEILTVRNSIVNLYKKEPKSYLTGTRCRSEIKGDIGLTLRLHDFLDSYEIINQPSLLTEPKPLRTGSRYMRTKQEIEIGAQLDRIAISQGIDVTVEEVQWSDEMEVALLDAVLKHHGNFTSILEMMKKTYVVLENMDETEAISKYLGCVYTRAPSNEDRIDPIFKKDLRVLCGTALSIPPTAAQSVISKIIQYDPKNKNDMKTHLAILQVLSKLAVSADAQSQLPEERAVLANMVQEYRNMRMLVLEEVTKLNFLTEYSQQIEMERQKSDRRDVQITRAYAGYIQKQKYEKEQAAAAEAAAAMKEAS